MTVAEFIEILKLVVKIIMAMFSKSDGDGEEETK